MPGSYEDDLPGDAPIATDGDGFFAGLDSRSEPENLAPGIVSVAENMRFNERKAVVRAGMEKQTNDISFNTVPLILPFSLLGGPVIEDVYGGGLYETCVWSDMDTNDEFVAMAGPQSAFLFRPANPVLEIAYPSGQTITDTDQVDMFQVMGSLYILRGMDSVIGISNLSRTGATATVNTSSPHEQSTGRLVTITGAYPDWYNVTDAVITVVDADTFTYTTGAVTDLGGSMLETAVTNVHELNYNYAGNFAANTDYTISVYAKPNGRDWLQLRLSVPFQVFTAFFNITTGTVGTVGGSPLPTASIIPAGNGWYRCVMSFHVSTGGAGGLNPLLSTNGTTTSYLGDITKGAFLYGAQTELGAAVSVYEPTGATVGTRNIMTYSEDLSQAIWQKLQVTATANATAEPASGEVVLTTHKAPLRWDGDPAVDFVEVSQGVSSTPYIYMPASDFGLIMQNRAILQYARNEAIVSEVLAVERYNSIFGVFAFRQGEADYLIGFHPYQDNECLVFNRRSVFILDQIDGDVSVMPQRELTRQMGCVSRRSITTCGQFVMFLSDNGVYVLQPGLELQLRGNTEPLSAAIQPTIDSINTASVQKAFGCFFNNRYYLAIPTGSNTRNDKVIVYNFLNSQWESVDTFPTGFFCDHMEVINDGTRDALYLISQEGGIYQAEVLEVDEFGASDQDPSDFLIMGNLITRRLIYGNSDLKRFSRLSANLRLHDAAAVTVGVITENPEKTKTVLTRSTTTEEDMTARGLVGLRAYGAQVQFQNTATRAEITNYQMQAYTQDRKSVTIT